MNGTTDWLSAIAVLSAGLILGAMFVYFFARRKVAAPPKVDLELRDLEAKRDGLIAQLRQLDETAGDERTRLELETARVLRDIDAHQSMAGAQPAALDSRRSTMIGFAWGAGSVAALALLGYLVMSAATPRDEVQPTMGQRPPAADPLLQQLEAAVHRQPDDLTLRMQLTQAYLERENLMGVFEQTQYVLSRSPDEPRALTYQALVRMAMGQNREALDMLRRATKSDPTLLDAWVGLAWAHSQQGDMNAAEKAIQEAMRRHPEEKARLDELMSQMRSHRPLPADHPPVDTKAIRVTLDLDASARARAAGGIIYLIARPEGSTSGPPVAVKRIDATRLPVTVDLSSADSMMGQPLPAKVRVEARLDADGDATTKNPSDPFAAQDSVTAGSTIRLSLK